jgi:hypothetical protein
MKGEQTGEKLVKEMCQKGKQRGRTPGKCSKNRSAVQGRSGSWWSAGLVLWNATRQWASTALILAAIRCPHNLPLFQNRGWLQQDTFFPPKSFVSLCHSLSLGKDHRCLWKEPWMTGRLALSLSPIQLWTFIYYVCVPYFQQVAPLHPAQPVCLRHPNPNRLYSNMRTGLHTWCSMTICSRCLWTDDIIWAWNGCFAPLPPPSKRCVLHSSEGNLLSTKDALRKSPRMKLRSHHFRLFILWTWECWQGVFTTLFAIVCVRSLQVTYIFFIWMYFEAVGRITKAYENHELNGPLYVFRQRNCTHHRKYQCKNQQCRGCSI